VKAKNEFYDTEDLKRVNKKALRFNNLELKALNYYFKKYHVRNQSRFMRETIIKSVLSRFDEEYPTLFDNQPTLFSQHNWW
jgi:hypothetical protein